MRRSRSVPLLLAVCAPLVAAIAGCGGGGSGGKGAVSAGQYEKALAGSPAPLAALHAQAGQVLDGGGDAVRARLARLRGYPVVVNAWASWCEPCKAEYPYIQQAVMKYGKRVAFLGLDELDTAADAKGFLRDHQVPYPHYEDRSGAILRSFAPSPGVPVTLFLGRDGKLAFPHVGQFHSAADLDAAIQRYALGAGS